VNDTSLRNTGGNSLQSFDLEKYLRTTGGTCPETFDWSNPDPRLEDDALFCVGYMMDIESNTIVYLREMLSTAIVEDASITTFLSCWAYEEFLHSQVLKRLLESQGFMIDDRRFVTLRRARPADYLAQEFARLLYRITPHFPASTWTWGGHQRTLDAHWRSRADRQNPASATDGRALAHHQG
jgi:hypothetical protein